MTRGGYERLSALDHLFLLVETPHALMHVASTGIFEAAAVRRPEGGIDFEALLRATESVLHRLPRYRQKLRFVPFDGRPVWVDDAGFNLRYHVRHTGLPRPGSERQLKRLAARILSQHLDRSKPLWEMWVVEGLEGDRFAVINKVHHCMVDGVAGVDLIASLLSASPDAVLPEPPPFVPRAVPSGAELLRAELAQRVRLPVRALLGLGALVRDPERRSRELAGDVRAAVEACSWMLRAPSPTPFNGPIGAHRRFDWLVTDRGAVDAIRKNLGGTLNDVVLAAVSGAVRAFLVRRDVDPARVRFRVLAPVSVRPSGERAPAGNRVSAWILDLPVGEPDPRRRLERIRLETTELKETHQAAGLAALAGAAELAPSTLLGVGLRAAARALPYNLIVTNVPGPPRPLYALGARMTECYPTVPLIGAQALGVALFSYADRLCWGFNADWERLPDLHDFVDLVDAAVRELRNAAAPLEARAARRHPSA